MRVYDKLQLQPEYEIDPVELELLSKVGEGGIWVGAPGPLEQDHRSHQSAAEI